MTIEAERRLTTLLQTLRQRGHPTPMPTYLYSAWFEDLSGLEDDEDREWIACIAIEADTSDAAKQWGDTLSIERSSRAGGNMFLRSDIEPSAAIGSADWSAVPRIVAGQRVSDDVLGW